jgi:hypothetical protein
MPDVKYQEDSNRFTSTGLGLNTPIDMMPPGKFPFLQNLRSTPFGELVCRPGAYGLCIVVSAQTPTHSIRHLADPRNAADAYIVGTGTHVAVVPTPTLIHTNPSTDTDSGYSGDPLALVPYRPESSPDPWMYIADRLRMRKIRRDGALHTIGLPAPANAPTVALGIPRYKVVSDFTTTAVWANTGDAGAPSLLSAGPGYRTTGTITQILYDTGTTGWCLMSLSSMVGVGVGERLDVNAGAGGTEETVVAQEVHPVSGATTIGSIIYDSGTSGLCSIVLSTALIQAEVNSMIRDTTVAGTENARVLAVVLGPDGSTSLRVSTVGTWVAADAVQLLATIRTYTVNAHSTGETVRIDGIRTAVTTGAPGYLRQSIATNAGWVNQDLSLFGTGIPITSDDLMHISLRTDRPDLVTEIKVQLDVDTSINDFTRNFFTYTLRAGDLTPAVRNLATLIATRQQVIQNTITNSPIVIRDILPPNFNALSFGDQVNVLEGLGFSPDDATQLVVSGVAQATAEQQGGLPDSTGMFGSNTAVSAELGLGDIQWSEVQFSLNQLTRVGTDATRTLANVAAIQLVFTVTGNVNVDMDSWWVGGGYGPDSTDPTASPYLYRFRARHPVTNVSSNWSPAIRGGTDAFRQQVIVTPYPGTPTQYPLPPAGSGSAFSGSAGDFVLDIARFGGSIPSWKYVGTINNSANNALSDIYPDTSVAGNPDSVNADYQMWPIQDVPRAGTTAQVTGTTVLDSGANFNLAWAPGTRILINQVAYTIYRVISTSLLELVENATTLGAVPWRIDSPTLLAQNLACLWISEDTFFACGDNTNGGRLYYSKRASETTELSFVNPDGTSLDWGYLDVTPPSEPLMNGVAFNARNMLFSSDRMFEILPTGLPAQPWTYQEIPDGVGLFSRWAIPLYGLKGSFIPFLGRNGIYKTDGGPSVSMTDRDLFPLFPNEGNVGVSVNGVQAPNVIAANAASMRMEFYDGYIYFTYLDLNGLRRTLIYSTMVDGWFYDTPGPVFYYGDEGTVPATAQAGASHNLYAGGADLLGTGGGQFYQFLPVIPDSPVVGAIIPIACEVLTPSRDQGSPREQKLYGDIMVDMNANGQTVVLAPTINNNTGTPPFTTVTTFTGRSQIQVPTYIPATNSWQMATNVGLDIKWSFSAGSNVLLYVWEPRFTFASAPILAQSWEISPSTFGLRNYKSLGWYRITHVSTVDLTMVAVVDGVAQPAITIPNSGGVQLMTVGRFPVYKGKVYVVRIFCANSFQLDTRDSFIQVKEWASPSAYQEMRVFADFANVQG